MRGRMVWTVMLAASILLAGGCHHMTPEQKRQRDMEKQATAQAKADQKRAAAQAKADAEARKKQAEMDRKQAALAAKEQQRQAAEDRKRQEAMAADQKKQADAQARADKKAGDEAAADAKKQADMDRKQAAMAAKEQKKQAAMMAKADKKHAPPAAAAMTSEKAERYFPDDQLKVIGYPYIKPENHQRIFDRQVQMMAAAGEHQDATLTDADFDDGELNSTGRSNLALALQYPSADNKLTVYLTSTAAGGSGGEGMAAARATSVQNYWKNSKWSGVQLATKDGPNPQVNAPASAGLNALKRLERQQGPGGASATAGGSDTTGGRSRMGGGGSNTSDSTAQ